MPLSFLPILHYTLLIYSPLVAAYIAEKGFELYAKSDAKFVELAYKLLVDYFNYKPSLTTDQFFKDGYAEKKVMLCIDIIGHIK